MLKYFNGIQNKLSNELKYLFSTKGGIVPSATLLKQHPWKFLGTRCPGSLDAGGKYAREINIFSRCGNNIPITKCLMYSLIFMNNK